VAGKCVRRENQEMNRKISILSSRLLATSLTLAACSVDGQLNAHTPRREPFTQRQDAYFTVKDSIEMSRFERGDGGPSFSPDKKYFAVVTSRGILRSDEIESTLWVFRADDVRKFLARDDALQAPAPLVVARLAAIPRGDYDNSYEPVISNDSLRWSRDSRTILFLGQDSKGKHQLYRATVGTGRVRALTPEKNDVGQFECVGNTTVYSAAIHNESRDEGYPIDADARDITGISLERVLFPKGKCCGATYSGVWVNRNEQNLQITDPDTKLPLLLVDQTSKPLSISPDGKAVVLRLPSKAAQKSWESYEPGSPLIKKIDSADPKTTANYNVMRPTVYTLVDLTSGRVAQLLNAPHAWTLGYDVDGMAIWSSDGKKLLLTNTFLTLEGVDEVERSKRLRPCTAVVVDRFSKAASCVAFSDGRSPELQEASFGVTDNDVILRFEGVSPEQRYHYQGGSWHSSDLAHIDQPVGDQDALLNPSQVLTAQIRQDLNTPPALWATDQKTKRSKRIWDPNPQLAKLNLGEVTVFRWKDKAGYEWTGGLVKPPDYVLGKRYPLVIQTHGFAEREFMTDGNFTTASAARPLASTGIAVLQMMDRDDDLSTADEASNRVLAFESAIDRLASDGLIDPDRVGITGFSRTCYHVESALINDPKRFAAASIADGVDMSYMQELMYRTLGVPLHEGEAIYGAKPFGEGLRQNWVQRAPGFHLDGIQAPLLIEAITPASILEEWEIYASLVAQGKAVDMIYFPDGQHVLQKPLERMASQQGNVDWFRFWLKGEEDSDPAKAEQYARWREMKKMHGENNHKAKSAPTN
jgi:dipeptidyl aminopeptidase/acylaminoacyl peptidase